MPRKPKEPNENNITIADSSIPWSFIWLTFGKCGKDWDCTIDCFWKCRKSIGKNGVQRLILAGLRHPTKYMLQPSKERENGQMESIRQWWLGLYERKKDASKDCADMIAALSSKFDLGGIFANPKN